MEQLMTSAKPLHVMMLAAVFLVLAQPCYGNENEPGKLEISPRTGKIFLAGKEVAVEIQAHAPKPGQPAPEGDAWIEDGKVIITFSGDEVLTNEKDRTNRLNTSSAGIKSVTYTATQKWMLLRNRKVTAETSFGKSAEYTVVKVHKFEMSTLRNPEKQVAQNCLPERNEFTIVLEPANAELYFGVKNSTEKTGPNAAILADSNDNQIKAPFTVVAKGTRITESVDPFPAAKIIREKQIQYITLNDNYYRWIATVVATPKWKLTLTYGNYSAATGISDVVEAKWPMGPGAGHAEIAGKGVFSSYRSIIKLPGDWIISPIKVAVPDAPNDGWFRDIKQYHLVYEGKLFSQYSIASKTSAARPDLVADTDWKAVGTDYKEYSEPLKTTAFHYHWWRIAP
ncbi:MAG TPA: hypothetical protein VK970_24605 [Candidatus Methylacidiphilales bacterium]|nr:hypothetical protein [Candidatus Methylacidiphilales bacterium]